MAHNILLDDENCIIYDDVYIVDTKTKCKIQELKNTLLYNITYELELTKQLEKYTYDELLQKINIFLVPDLIKIVYEYLCDKIKLYTILYESESSQPKIIHFALNMNVYTFYKHLGSSEAGIILNTCPKSYEKDVKKTIKCVCTPTEHQIKMIKSMNDGQLEGTDTEKDDTRIIYKIFKWL